MLKIEDYKCTCNSTATIDHSSWCDLWTSEDFKNEDAVWIDKDQRLYTYEMHRTSLLAKGIGTKEILDKWIDMYINSGPATSFTDRCRTCGTELYCEECTTTIGLCTNPDHEIDPGTYFCVNCDINETIDGFEELKAEIQALPELECTCTPQAYFSCGKCGVWKSNKDARWYRFGTPDTVGGNQNAHTPPRASGVPIVTTPKPGQYQPTFNSYGGYQNVIGGGYTAFQKCRHYDSVLKFPNGVEVHPSSLQDRKPGDGKPVPDFGLYLASSWKPASLAYYLDWPDYGIPTWYEVAYQSIQDAYGLAEGGSFVEVGCIGGHGRTGTAVACMAIIAGVPTCEAVEWVRKNYCEHAIESEKQEWWVQWFGARFYGLEPPPQPAPPPIKKYEPPTPPTKPTGPTGQTSLPAPAHGIEVSSDSGRLSKRERKRLRQLRRRNRRDLR
jgi:hypothetical protein